MNRLNEIEARANAATEGPWFPNRYSEDWEVCGELDDNGNPALVASEAVGVDAEFIAHARADVPDMVAALRAVLEVHTPDYTYPDCPKCSECSDIASTRARRFAVLWPCATVEAIRQHIGDDL